MKYKHLLLSPLSMLPAALPANAAPPPPVFNWSGYYVGANVGFVSDRSSAGSFQSATTNCFAADCAFTNSQTSTGVLGGLQIGYNFQTANRIVWGVETDLAFSSAKSSGGGLSAGGSNWAAETGVNALGTLRLRFGYAFDRSMIYATGGLAYADLRNTFRSDTGYTWSNRAGWRAGYTVGAGAEMMINRMWSVKAEALYYDLGSKDHASVGAGDWTLSDHTTGVVGRIGLNYMFGR